MSKKIALLYGGYSREREISIKSGKAVEGSLQRLGYDYQVFDPIEKDKFIEKIIDYKPDLAFIALHGKGGEDGTIQSLLEFLDIPYTGSDSKTSMVCMDKVLTKMYLEKFGINTPKWNFFLKIEDALSFKPDFPAVVKAPNEGSSIGVYIVNNQDEYKKAIEEAFKLDEKVLVEQFIRGRELTVGILDDEVFDIVEVVVEEGFYDYQNKYITGKTKYICPAELPSQIYKTVQNIGYQTYKTLNCKGQARVDIILDYSLTPYVLEVNTIPGMTEFSLLPKAAAVKGISFDQLVERIIKSGLKK
ncbi:D-alanine--D-alanine ligase [Sulfurihydrogenibium subterraneum]|uniref:D-alanine--D-alanine ligase n=1 Tax=Sulfurihydrogenibium subterraneum TaxID=171121 RepID=UPI00048DB35E|nr:D-alanine--D-alanine ligase [Sulfurihydrogenibium subterraneum]